MKWTAYIIVFLVAIMAAMAASNQNYSGLGANENAFVLGSGIIDSGNPSFHPTFTGVRTLVTGNNSAIVGEVDNDSVNEIVVQDANTITIYRGTTLDIVASYTLPAATRFTNALLFDLNGDGKDEIIVGAVSAGSPKVYILEKKGAALQLNKTFILATGAGAYLDGDMQIVCGKTNECVAALGNVFSGSGTGWRTIYNYFNWSNQSALPGVAVPGGGNSGYVCAPKSKVGAYADYDASGAPSYIFSWIGVGKAAAAHDILYVDYVKVNATNDANRVAEITNDLGDILKTSGDTNCDQVLWTADSSATEGAGSLFTNPLVYDFHTGGQPGAAMGTAIGYMSGKNAPHIQLYNSDLSARTTFPTTIATSYDGAFVGNLFRANIYPLGKNGLTNKQIEFCMPSYTIPGDYMYIDCGSDQGFVTSGAGGFSSSSVEFQQYIGNITNVSTSSLMLNTISNSVQMRSTAVGAENNILDQVTSGFGVSEFTRLESCLGGSIGVNTNRCPLDLIYANTKPNAIFIPVDVQKIGKDDVLMTQNNALWYLDDGFVILPPVITSVTTNPCTNSIWNLSTPLLITITLTDPNSYNVGADAILYYGTPNAQDSGWSANYTSGTTISISNLIPNVSISSGTLRISGRNTATATTSTYDIPFNVGTNGVVFGACQSTFNPSQAAAANASNYSLSQLPGTTNLPNTNDNAIKNAAQTINQAAGGGLGLATIWFILMIVAAIGIWSVPEVHRQGDTKQAVGIIAIVEVMMVILGVWLGFFGIGIIIVFVCLGLLVAAAFMRRVTTGG